MRGADPATANEAETWAELLRRATLARESGESASEQVARTAALLKALAQRPPGEVPREDMEVIDELLLGLAWDAKTLRVPQAKGDLLSAARAIDPYKWDGLAGAIDRLLRAIVRERPPDERLELLKDPDASVAEVVEALRGLDPEKLRYVSLVRTFSATLRDRRLTDFADLSARAGSSIDPSTYDPLVIKAMENGTLTEANADQTLWIYLRATNRTSWVTARTFLDGAGTSPRAVETILWVLTRLEGAVDRDFVASLVVQASDDQRERLRQLLAK